ncbi:circadian locomoter output cycles protein kaput-like isoform X1 [Pomacea canaliculata]|uniref:circadian locomoter output cycles protein kaput-like isoform X1 n=1 Tax=Pomacea canaliculata TaxID=400727 RepID=UPI000D72827A|nr:circadian locomoter output cycles protein kaput-like isoform X1 [Pomacea canaliculata]
MGKGFLGGADSCTHRMYPLYEEFLPCESVLSFDDLEDDEKDNVKRKTRNLSEKKRRDQFNMLINELCSMVAANNKKMDKSTVLKSAIQFLKTHQEISVQSAANEIKEDWKPTFLCNEEFAQLMLEAVDSFLIVFTQQGSVLYVSESVTSLLGHLPNDLINRSFYDFVHEDDHVKIYNLLSTYCIQTSNTGHDFEKDENQLSFTCHFRRGTIDPEDQSTYEFVRVSGSSRLLSNDEDFLSGDDIVGLQSSSMSVCFCCTVRLQTSHIIREMSNVDEATCEFTSRHSLEWKFLFLDHRAPPIIGYLPFEVLGTSGYDYYHPEDIERVAKCHEQLMQMGEGTSCYYRFLTKGQQWIWLRTRYYITYHQWNSKPEFIVCTNTVVKYADVRAQLRRDLGYVEEETFSASILLEAGKGDKTHRSSSVCSVSSGGVGGQTSDVDSSQHPHSTEKEPGSTKKYVTSQLQSLLQQHLQRNTLRNHPRATSTSSTSNHPTTTIPRIVPNILPIMAMPPSMITLPHNQQQVVSQTRSVESSSVLSPGIQTLPMQAGLFLTPAQKLLHDHLVQKSERLQDTIRQQQEELRQITQQLAQAQTGVQSSLIAVPEPGTPSSLPLLLAPNGSVSEVLSMINPGNSQILLSQLMEPSSHSSSSQATGPFQIVSPDSDMGFGNNDLSDSC